MNTQIMTLAGKPVIEDGVTITVGVVLASALDVVKGNDGPERLAYYHLARKCYEGDEVEITPDELFTLRKVLDLSQIQSNVILGQVLDALK